MIGLMQIMIYMLSLYLVYKGVEVLQVALMSARPNRTGGLVVGTFAVVIAIIAAVGFSFWADQVAASIGERMNTIPSLTR
jgi:hypothetical protein